jgi:hypothetical protein
VRAHLARSVPASRWKCRLLPGLLVQSELLSPSRGKRTGDTGGRVRAPAVLQLRLCCTVGGAKWYADSVEGCLVPWRRICADPHKFGAFPIFSLERCFVWKVLFEQIWANAHKLGKGTIFSPQTHNLGGTEGPNLDLSHFPKSTSCRSGQTIPRTAKLVTEEIVPMSCG